MTHLKSHGNIQTASLYLRVSPVWNWAASSCYVGDQIEAATRMYNKWRPIVDERSTLARGHTGDPQHSLVFNMAQQDVLVQWWKVTMIKLYKYLEKNWHEMKL